MNRYGRMNLLNAKFAEDEKPVDANCGCYTCHNFSRAYLRHLIQAKEMLASTLLSIHNIHTLLQLTAEMQEAIAGGQFEGFYQDFQMNYSDAKHHKSSQETQS